MKLYIADHTCSQAVQIIANEIGIEPELIHFDVFERTTSSGENFAEVNPLAYVPVLELDTENHDRLTETIVILAHLADQHPGAKLAPEPGSLARARLDQFQVFAATEIAQKHIPLMRKLLTEDGTTWTRNKLVAAYRTIDDRLAESDFIFGDRLSVADIYVWATMWSERSGAEIGHLKHLTAWKARMDARPSVRKALADEAAIVAIQKAA